MARACRLYSLPAVAMEVLELTDNPKVDVPALKQCIENDPALTTKVLRVVNSSLFGLSREVSDLNQALSLLGTKPLKLLVLGFSLPERLFQGVAVEILGWYWRQTLTKAVAAREIANLVGRQSGDEAFIAGLLQDLGILLLLQELGEPYVRFLQKVRGRGSDLAMLEKASLGFDHTALTARLLHHWGLPHTLVDAVCRIDSPPPPLPLAPSEPSLAEIVHWAGLVARLVTDGNTDVLDELIALDDPLQGLSREQLEQLVGELEAKVKQLAEVLSLRLPEGRNYQDVLIEAHLQLAQVAAEVAEEIVGHQAGPGALESEGRAFEHESQALLEAVARISQPGADPVASAPPSRPAAQPAARSSASAGAEAACGSQTLASPAAEVDPAFFGRLEAAVAACRQSQCALTLLLVELDDLQRLLTSFGVQGLDKVRDFLQNTCRSLDHPDAVCLPYRDHGFAVILPDCERQPAVRLANQLINRMTPDRSPHNRSAFSISVGAATLSVPPKNFHPEDLLEGAHRCLYGSHASGGSVVKSIEIY